MTLDELRATLADDAPPANLSPALVALWHDAKDDWAAAHDVAQRVADEDGAWIHAYLHRKEGDISNAAYWYRRAGKPVASGSLESEWQTLAAAFLAGS